MAGNASAAPIGLSTWTGSGGKGSSKSAARPSASASHLAAVLSAGMDVSSFAAAVSSAEADTCADSPRSETAFRH